jgi:uncharacterized protein YkwD
MTKFKITFLIFIVILGGVFFFWEDILDFYLELSLKLPQIEKGFSNSLVKEQEAEKQISTPPPLRATKEDPQPFLTQAGVIWWTNVQREKEGLPPLKENAKLNLSAELKIQDMFAKQYFSHYSPLGEGVNNFVESVGYEFIAIGENLALGNFQNDQALIQGWMDSPGHRENILSARYQEIGVAVLKGTFEGKSIWLAVQHFGLPLSACPLVDEELKAEIETNQEQIKELQKTLELLEVKIRTIRPRWGPVYNQAIEEYNSLVSQYNELVKETEILINKYNYQVILFNECVFVEE